MPCDYSKYPPDWKQIRARILFRADNQCECEGECGLHRSDPAPRRCCERHGTPAKWARGRVVLTIAHLNHDTADNRPANLKAMCQRCPLRYDRDLHKQNAARTRTKKRTEIP